MDENTAIIFSREEIPFSVSQALLNKGFEHFTINPDSVKYLPSAAYRARFVLIGDVDACQMVKEIQLKRREQIVVSLLGTSHFLKDIQFDAFADISRYGKELPDFLLLLSGLFQKGGNGKDAMVELMLTPEILNIGKGARILVVSDSERIRNAFKILLSDAKYESTGATPSQAGDCIDAANEEKKPYALALVDWVNRNIAKRAIPQLNFDDSRPLNRGALLLDIKTEIARDALKQTILARLNNVRKTKSTRTKSTKTKSGVPVSGKAPLLR